MLLDELEQFRQQAPSLGCRHTTPRAFIECMTRRAYCQIDIGRGRGRNRCEYFAVGRADDIDTPAGEGIASLSADPLDEGAAFGDCSREGNGHGVSSSEMLISASARLAYGAPA
jgi:hypothetical protein